ncbi:uncharacterized protein LOC134031520 [Osmerus eperlanus]|uniref:uncharacterized protein LOC134031520 n=1 Tax=Osmerus eperlanus TaxID=29151 RepID=UPI002E14D1BC
MAKTFSSRRHEVVNLSPCIQDFMERWPALFGEARIAEEFQRITAVPLLQTFMRKLDSYTPRLLNIMRAKGGVPGTKIRPILDTLNQRDSIERRRDAVIRSLIEYLGESGVELFLDCQEADRHENTHHILKVLVVHAATDEDPVDVSIIIEGNEVLTKCDNTAKACTLLMGLLYALNLEYPAKLKYTFEVFQKLFLELDGIKLSSKVQSLRTKLLA